MWQVTANGTQGSTYVYEIDLPDYAPNDAVFEAACKAHAHTRRDRNITEYLDILPTGYAVRLLYPQGQREKLDALLGKAVKAELTLHAEDIEWRDGEAVIDGIPADDWFRDMTMD